jgi:DNA-binding transcriptional ArsR family regulator
MKALRSLIGSATRAKILLYLSVYKETYPRELTINLKLPLFGVQTQLKNLLRGGVVVVKKVANRQMFSFSPSYTLKKELLALLKKALKGLPEKERSLYLNPKMTPRAARKGKAA